MSVDSPIDSHQDNSRRDNEDEMQSSWPAPQKPASEQVGQKRFSFTEARSLISDLTKPNPLIYWADFLTSIFGAYLAAAATLKLPQAFWPSWWVIPVALVTYTVAVVLFMRSVMFIHELVHLPREGFKGFRIAWNVLCGIPLFVPSFLYYPHVDHHRRKHYGTEHDGEYLSLSHHSRWMIVGFIAQALLIPFVGFLRFAVISPICWIIPGARTVVHRHASTMLVDPLYEREDASPQVMQTVVLQEACCFLIGMSFVFGHKIRTGVWFDPAWVLVYCIALGLLILNEVRTLGAHRWTGDGTEMSFEAQLLDSVNYPHNPWLSELWGPIGTRYHALHHLFPSLPYHNLGKAHVRLVEGLPDDSPYHDTIAKSLSDEIKALWNRAGGGNYGGVEYGGGKHTG